MTKNKLILCRHLAGDSYREISAALHVSRNTVAKVIAAYESCRSVPGDISAMSEAELSRMLFPENEPVPERELPNFDLVHQELARPGVTLKILWEEYAERCAQSATPAYRYSRFCDLYKDFIAASNVTSRIMHKPGNEIMVDWAGKTFALTDPLTGAKKAAYLFVGVLPYSMYCYAEAFTSMDEACWIAAHVHMFAAFGGAARLLVCDNTKTAVLHHGRREDPIVNRVYQELAEHYGTAVLPARVRSPKDKSAVEGTVKCLTSNTIGRLRNEVFFRLDDLNDAIRPETRSFNDSPFQKRPFSRTHVFVNEERQLLLPLPPFAFEQPVWKTLTVQKNCHVYVNKRYYSVPYQYVGKKVDVRTSSDTVAVYHEETLLCTHKRYGSGAYETNLEHMPEGSRRYQDWSAERFLSWAQHAAGPETRELLCRLFASRQVEEQAYRQAFGIMGLVKKHGKKRSEEAAALMNISGKRPSCSNLELVLTQLSEKEAAEKSSGDEFAITRGSAYYGGGYDDN